MSLPIVIRFPVPGSTPKIIRDPVHGLIPFDVGANDGCDELLLALINSREFQRLRRIKQLGMSQYVFPGADHSRFSHSIGVMHTARLMIDRIARLGGLKVEDDDRTVVLAAALVHDVGHGPFSHTFENVLKAVGVEEKHERRTREIILDKRTDIATLLSGHKRIPDLPRRVAAFFDKESPADDPPGPAGSDDARWMTAVVASQFDADRFDYLRRDSLATGDDFGNFDQDWLIENLRVDAAKGRFYLSRKALSAVERYVFARHHMYQSVYFYKTTRAAEVMLRLLLVRYQKLLREAGGAAGRDAVVRGAPPEVREAIAAERTSLPDYLRLDDHSVTAFLKACERDGKTDPALRDLAVGLLHRKLYKAWDVTHLDVEAASDFHVAAREAIAAAGKDPNLVWARDSAKDTPYKAYDPDAEKPATVIYVEAGGGGQVALSKESEPVRALTGGSSLLRYYAPPSLREAIDAAAKPYLGKDAR